MVTTFPFLAKIHGVSLLAEYVQKPSHYVLLEATRVDVVLTLAVFGQRASARQL